MELAQLEEMILWAPEHAPGARFRVLRSDFCSENAVQERGENYIAAALRSFLADPPEVHYLSCPPHVHASDPLGPRRIGKGPTPLSAAKRRA